MSRFPFLLLVLITGLMVIVPAGLIAQTEINHPESSTAPADTAEDKYFDFSLRFGMGGFRDSRSPVHTLGGDQIALVIRPRMFPVAVAVSSEYYTNSAEPTHSYEIASLYAINLLYIKTSFSNEKLDYFIGGGAGRLEVPDDVINPGSREKDFFYNLEAGVNYKYFERFGFYGALKYLNAEKTVSNIKLIDFNERIVLVGVTYNFSM